MDYQSDIINVAVVNFKVTSGNKESNLARMRDFSIAAAKRGADLVLFPEMALMGYDYYINDSIPMAEKVQNAETVEGSSVGTLAQVSKKYGIYIVFGAAEKDKDSGLLYNSAVAVGPEGCIGAYRKMHPFETESIWC